MTKHEFMARLASELRKRNIADAADVIEEYEQHFAFKLADGYAEEEIAAKLGSPEELAAQFESTDTAKKVGGGRAVLRGAGGLPAGRMEHCRSDPRDAVLVRRDPGAQLCGAYGAARGRLRLLRGVFAAARPLLRRSQHNALASASGEAALPALAINPQFSAKTRRRLRAAALISLALFAACFVLSYVVCALSAGSLQFWHAWGWFQN